MKFVSDYIVFSAPSGGGKTTIAKTLEQKYDELVISVSATTRPQRPNERNGVDYYFLSPENFKEAIQQDRFLEYEQVHGYYYGTLKEKVDEAVGNGKTVLFDID
ncbi:MAG TPA: guanylate kinase, partial [Calditrichaeota bacterium]|nr:guanylate kinase [Calditrichota bacterium]